MESKQLNQEEIEQIAEDYQYSDFMVRELMINYPDDYLEVIRAFEKPSLEMIRTNTLKIQPQALKKRLENKGFRLKKAQWIDYAYIVDTRNSKLSLGATHEYLMGYYYIQDLASMIPVYFLSPRPGDKVIDMCAAPGGKTTHIGQYLKQKGTIIAIDRKESRLKSLISNINRCGILNSMVFPYDGKDLNKIPKFRHWANKILLDAPCTGSGIIRKDKSRKMSRNLKDVKEMAKIQKSLLKTGLEILKPGGLLLYSTCSFHYRENEQVVAEVSASRDDVNIIEPFKVDIGLPGLIKAENREFGYDMLKTRRMYPNVHDTDAFFYCLLEKKK